MPSCFALPRRIPILASDGNHDSGRLGAIASLQLCNLYVYFINKRFLTDR